jgi:hypothetical protein
MFEKSGELIREGFEQGMLTCLVASAPTALEREAVIRPLAE